MNFNEIDFINNLDLHNLDSLHYPANKNWAQMKHIET